MIQVETIPDPAYDMTVRVTTTDATNTKRVYRVSAGTETLAGKRLMQSRKLEPNPDDTPFHDRIGATETALEAAAKRFEAAGYEVYGR